VSQEFQAPKCLSAAISGNIASFRAQLNRAAAGTLRGSDEVEELVHAGLAIADEQKVLRPQLAVQVPTAENGRWVVFPDGRMQTTWTIRPNAVWHDGAPVVADDFTFTAQIAQDPELPGDRTRESRQTGGPDI
jgi:ABC-type transport system substrate-binding protein